MDCILKKKNEKEKKTEFLKIRAEKNEFCHFQNGISWQGSRNFKSRHPRTQSGPVLTRNPDFYTQVHL